MGSMKKKYILKIELPLESNLDNTTSFWIKRRQKCLPAGGMTCLK